MKSLETELKEIDELIEENKRLQKKYPNKKWELEVGLQSLMELRKEVKETVDRMG